MQDRTLFRNDFPNPKDNMNYASEGTRPRASPQKLPNYNTHPLYPDVQTPGGDINDFKTVNPSLFDSSVENLGNDMLRSRYDDPNTGSRYDNPNRGSRYDNQNTGSRYDNPSTRSRYDNGSLKSKSRSKDRNRSVTPEMQDLDDDYLADNLKFYNDDPDYENPVNFGRDSDKPNIRRENIINAANYDTNDLQSDLNYDSKGTRNSRPNDLNFDSKDSRYNRPNDLNYDSRNNRPNDLNYDSKNTRNSKPDNNDDPYNYISLDLGNSGQGKPGPGNMDLQNNNNIIEDGEDYIMRMKKPETKEAPPPPKPKKVKPPPPPKKEKPKKPKKKPEPIHKEPEVKIIEVPVQAPLPSTAEVNLSCTTLEQEEKTRKEEVKQEKERKAALFVSLFDMKLNSVKVDQETMKFDDPPEAAEMNCQTDDINYEDKEVECDKKEVCDQGCGGNPITYAEFKMFTDPIVKDVKEFDLQTDPIEFVQISIKTDPEPVVEKSNKIMKTDPIQLKKKFNLHMKTDPEIKIGRAEFKIETDPEPFVEVKEGGLNILTDLEPAVPRFELIVITDPWVEFETQDNENHADPNLLEELLEQARIEA